MLKKYLNKFPGKTILFHVLSILMLIIITINGISIVGDSPSPDTVYTLNNIIDIILISIIIWLLGFYINKRK